MTEETLKKIHRLKMEHLNIQKQQVDIQKDKEKLKDKIIQLFREDKDISFDDFKYSQSLLEIEGVFEGIVLERLDQPDIKKIITEKMIKNLLSNNINFIAIQNYIGQDNEKQTNLLFFEHEIDELIEYKLKNIIDYIKNHIGEDPKSYFKDFYRTTC